jgi:hypothetical protein
VSTNFAATGPRIIPKIKAGRASPRNHFCLIFTDMMPYRIVKPPESEISIDSTKLEF